MSESHWANRNLPPVHIVTTTPELSEEALLKHRRCYMGISLDNPVFQGKPLEALLAWAGKHFDHCLVITGDYLRRHNEYILNGADDGAAVKASLAAGDAFIETTRGIFAGTDPDRLKLVRWQDCTAFDEYAESRAQLDRLFASDSAFSEAVRKDATAFVNRQLRRNKRLAVPEEEAVAVSCQYLLEEIAVFSALSERGWHVELYPGPELHVLVEVARGTFEDVPQGLKQRINVQLQCGRCGVEAQ
ncbi:MAG: tRNA-dependent cyclodipeptide synthase [Phycisphaerae bacterium]|nr:tRNA-dependent cyclodipeptide synthase [Phycisphaerae bacterium]